jgi:ABC-type multidrug transport system fused ATPase/permease subunit
MAHREREVGQLAVKKYLDALCVCCWALTTCLMAAATFGLAEWWRQPLTPATVLVSLSLFNVLILPLNALPWVLTGIVEAHVSATRLAAFLHQGQPSAANEQLQRAQQAASCAQSRSASPARCSASITPRCRAGEREAASDAQVQPLPSFGWGKVLAAQENTCGHGAHSGADGHSRLQPNDDMLAVRMDAAAFSHQAQVVTGCGGDNGDDAGTAVTLRNVSMCMHKVRHLLIHRMPLV